MGEMYLCDVCPGTSKGCAKNRARIKCADHGVTLNTPPHRDYSSSHGIGLVQAEEIPKVSELFNVQGFCEHVGYIFTSVDVSEVQVGGLYAFTQEMVFDIDVFDTRVEQGVLG